MFNFCILQLNFLIYANNWIFVQPLLEFHSEYRKWKECVQNIRKICKHCIRHLNFQTEKSQTSIRSLGGRGEKAIKNCRKSIISAESSFFLSVKFFLDFTEFLKKCLFLKCFWENHFSKSTCNKSSIRLWYIPCSLFH